MDLFCKRLLETLQSNALVPELPPLVRSATVRNTKPTSLIIRLLVPPAPGYANRYLLCKLGKSNA